MTKERVYLNSCQLLIESLTLYNEPQEDQFFFLWKKGKKFSRSNLYEIEANQNIIIRQKIQLGLKIYNKNGKTQPKNTRLYLMVCDSKDSKQNAERQVSEFVLPVHSWSSSFEKMQLQIKQSGRVIGLLVIQVKRRQVMELQNFHKFNGEIQQSSESDNNDVVMVNRYEKNGHSQTLKLQKQIEDYKYLNQKLKKDRGFLISRNEKLEKQIISIKSIVEAQMKRMEEYYAKKLEISINIYQQQIQSLISAFNQTSNVNLTIMKSIVNQNQELALEIEQLRITAEDELEKQNTYYKGKLNEANQQREKIEQIIQDLQLKIGDLQKQVGQSNRKFQMTKQQFDLLTINSQVERKQSKIKFQQYQKHLQTQRKQISDLKNQMTEKTDGLKRSKQVEKELEQQINQLKGVLQKYKIQQIRMENDINDKKVNIDNLKAERDENQQFIKRLQADYKKYIGQSQKANSQYQRELQTLQSQNKEKQIEFERLINQQRNKYYSETLKMTEMVSKLEDCEKDIIIKAEEIKTYIDENTKLNEQFLEEHTKVLEYEQQNHELYNQLQQLKITNQSNEDKITLLTEQLDNSYKKNQEDLDLLRQNFEQSLKNRQKYYEDQIQNLKIKLQSSQSSYLKLVSDFRAQTQQYKFLMDKSQQQQIQNMKDMSELASNNRRLQLQNKQFEELLNQARQAMKQRELKYEETLKMYSENQMKNRNRINPASSIDFQFLPNEGKNSHLLEPNRKIMGLQIPQMQRELGEQYQMQYYKQVQALGSLEHIRYLISVEEINKQIKRQLQKLQKQNMKLKLVQIEKKSQQQKNEGEVKQLKLEIQKLTQIIEQLQDQLRYYLQKQQERSEANLNIEVQQLKNSMNNLNNSFRSEDIKKASQKSIAESKEKDRNSLSRSKSRISKALSFINHREAQVQVQIISLAQIQKYQKQLSSLKSQLSKSRNQVPQVSQIDGKNRKQQKQQQQNSSAKKHQAQTNVPSNRDMHELTVKNKQLQKMIQQLQQQCQDKAEQLNLKQIRIEKVESRNRQIFDELVNYKQQMGMKISNQQSKILEYSLTTKRQEQEFQKMRQTVLQREEQLKISQQNLNQQIGKLNKQLQKMQEQNRKLKKDLKQQEQKTSKRGVNYQYTWAMQQDMQEANKKVIQLSKLNNQIRLQKQSCEDELRIVRKKILQAEKSISHSNDKRIAAEQQAEIANRKFNKAKREHEDKQAEVNKMKDQIKRMQQQINSYSNISNQNLIERKKNLQERLQMEQEINKKDSEIRKLTKQLQRIRDHKQEIHQFELTKKNQSQKKVQDLQSEYTKIRRYNTQLQQQILQSTNKLNNVEEQHRNKIEEMKSQYKEKLNVLMNDITEIKRMLDINNQEKAGLQDENANFREQLQSFSEQLDKCDKQREQFLIQRQQLEKQIGNNIHELQQFRKELMHYQQDNIDLHNKVASLQEQLTKQRLLSGHKSQKVEQYQFLSQKYEYQLKNLKSELKQQKDHQQTQTKLKAEIVQLQQKLQQLSSILEKLSKDHQEYVNLYKYSEQQIEQLVSELKQRYEEAHQRQLGNLKEELDQEYESKNIMKEKQMLQLYNQNAKFRVEIKRKQEQCAEILHKYQQVQSIKQKYSKIRAENQKNQQQLMALTENVNISQSKMAKQEKQLRELELVISNLKNQLIIYKNDFKNQKVKSGRFEQELLELQTLYGMTKQEFKKQNLQNKMQKDSQSNQLQTYQQKMLSLQLQNMRVKEREQNMHRQYKQQIKKLQLKVKESISYLEQQNSILQKQYKAKLQQKDRILKEANRTLNSVQADLNLIKQQMGSIKKQNEDLAYQLSCARQQMSEDQQIYITEINKLKNNIREIQQMYTYNSNALEEEIADLNRQLTIEQLNNRQQNGMTASRLRESQVQRRMEQRLKNKDSKIEQLKNNIFILEQTITSLKQKSSIEGTSDSSSQKYRNLYNDLSVEIRSVHKKHQQDLAIHEQTQKQLRKQIARSKQAEQNFKLLNDQQTLQLHSLQCQLGALKQIYETLQKQLERRQIKLTDNIVVSANYQKQLEDRNSRIVELEQEAKSKQNSMFILEQRLKSKQQQVDQLRSQLRKDTNELIKISNFNSGSKKTVSIQQAQIVCLRQELQSVSKQNKRLTNQIDLYKSKIEIYRKNQVEHEKQKKKFQFDYSSMMQKIYESQEIVGKYKAVESKSQENYGIGVQELILGAFMEQKAFDQQQQLNLIKQQVEQMRFNEDRRKMDLQELRKQNLELILKLEDYQLVQDQVETLRKICDKLEEQKKIAVFRQEAVRVRLLNLISRNQPRQSIRDGLEAILNCNYNVYV